MKDEIILTKNFCYAQNVYGAESYIKGFSGYSLELLVSHYKTLFNLIQDISKLKEIVRLVIDDANFYNGRENVLKELNEAKKQSPIILIDPTFKERNALSGLSQETFDRFQDACKKFLKNPSRKFFVIRKISEEFREYKNTRVIVVKTNKQVGDIAGTKSKKFFNFFLRKLSEEFKIKKSGFDYNEKENEAYFYFVLGKKKDEIKKGPRLEYSNNVENFKKAHKKVFIKGDFVYAKLKHDLSFNEWFKIFNKKYNKIINEMGIKEIKKEKENLKFRSEN